MTASAMVWISQGDYVMRCAPWTVAKVTVRGVVSYELWLDGTPTCAGRYATFDLAKEDAERRSPA